MRRQTTHLRNYKWWELVKYIVVEHYQVESPIDCVLLMTQTFEE